MSLGQLQKVKGSNSSIDDMSRELTANLAFTELDMIKKAVQGRLE